VEKRECLLGEVIEDQISPSLAGNAVLAAWADLRRCFPGAGFDEFVVMPNHVHGIVVLDVRPAEISVSLGDVMRVFKSTAALAANRVLSRSGRPFWQRNYFEHVVRGEGDLARIRQYIAENPMRWAFDPENPNRMKLP